MRFEEIKNVTSAYIFYNDDTSEKLTADILPEIISFATREMAFYGRLRYELDKRYTAAQDALKRTECPSDDDIERENLLEQIHMEQQREQWKAQCARVDQIHELEQDADRRFRKWERIMEVLTK